MDIFDQATETERLDREFSIMLAGSPKAQIGPIWRNNTAYCRECGEPIPVKRLSAIPNASYCLYCQEELDAESQGY